MPHLLIQVTTPPAATADGTMLPEIQDDLAQHALLPSTQLVDPGYLDAEALATSRTQFGIDLVGPTRGDYRWQARRPVRDQPPDSAQESEPFDRSHFAIDWVARRVTCPAGRTSTQWTPAEDRRPRVPRAVINGAFSAADCHGCPSHTRCTQQARRTLTLHPQAHEEALRAARRARARADARFRARLCPTGWRRKRACPRVAGLRLAAFALRRPSQDPSAARGHRGGAEPGAPQRLAHRDTPGADPPVNLRAAHGRSCLTASP